MHGIPELERTQSIDMKFLVVSSFLHEATSCTEDEKFSKVNRFYAKLGIEIEAGR